MTVIPLVRGASLIHRRSLSLSQVFFLENTAAAGSVSRNVELFDFEKNRQSSIGIEKILITVRSQEKEDQSFLMNKGSSTPYDVAKHISRHAARSSALCVIHGSENYLSMHSPIREKCTIELVDYHNKDHALAVNEAYWRSTTFLLGAGASFAFQTPSTLLKAHSDVALGHFSYDISSDGLQDGWNADASELSILSRTIYNEFVSLSLPFETLSVPFDSAKEFELQISDDVCDEEGNVTLCRVGDHVDVVAGPVVANTSHVGKYCVVKAFKKNGIVRLAGVSLPYDQPPSSYAWNLIMEHAEKTVMSL